MFKKDSDKEYLKNCWRLILGDGSKNQLGGFGTPQLKEMDQLLQFLYNREREEGDIYNSGGSGDGVTGKQAGRGGSQPSVFQWLKKIRGTFPNKTVEIMEKHAIDKYQLKEMLTDKKVLESMEPNKALLESILHMKGHMSPDVLNSAKRIVKTVVNSIKLSLEEKIYARFSSLLNRNRSTVYSMSGELDFIKTIGKNLQNYDPKTEQIMFENFYFYENIRKKNRWEIILCVDESGSMLDSVLYSSIMASIFATLPVFKTKLVIFDTEVVDLTPYLNDVIEIMFQVRLGGGTDIAKALEYCNTLINNPAKTIVVLVSDFYDWNMTRFYQESARILEGGSKYICIGALNEEGRGSYDKQAAKKLAEMGADVAALTPETLADWIKDIIK